MRELGGILERTSQAQARVGGGLRQPQVVAVEAAAAGGALEEVVEAEVGGGDADGEAELVALAGDLDDVDPEEEDLDGDALEVAEAVDGDAAADVGLVAERVGALDGELAGGGGVDVRREVAGGVVEGVGDDPLGDDARGEVEGRERLVGRRLGGRGASAGEQGEQHEEEGKHRGFHSPFFFSCS